MDLRRNAWFSGGPIVFILPKLLRTLPLQRIRNSTFTSAFTSMLPSLALYSVCKIAVMTAIDSIRISPYARPRAQIIQHLKWNTIFSQT